MKPTIYAVAILAAVFGLMWLEAGKRNSTARQQEWSNITPEIFNQMQIGMEYSSAEIIAGRPTTTISDERSTTPYIIATWKNINNGCLVRCVFIKGKLTRKDILPPPTS